MFKPAVTTKKGEKTEAEIKKEKDEKKKRADEKRLRMPYDVPPPRVINPAVLEEDVEIKHFQPLSDMKWYKKLRDQYEFPEPMDKIKQKRMKRIRLSRWEQFYEVPIRIKDQYKPKWRISSMTQDDLETVRPARHRTPSPEMEAYHRIRRRSLGDLSDEELLLPVNEYLSMKRTEEERLRLEEELELGYSASPPSFSPVRFELSALHPSSPRIVYSDDEEGEEIRTYDSYRIPSKYEAGPSFVDLRQRHDKATYKPPRQKQRVYEEREDQELLRPHTTAQRMSAYKSELKRMEFEEKTRTFKRESTVTVAKLSQEIDSEHLTSFTSEYVPKPIKKLQMPEVARRSPTPERAAKTEVTLPKVDYASRYEERKQALRSERKSMERTFEVVTQAPFSLDHAPRITIRMRSHRVPYGSSTRFTLNVQTKPEPEVQWFHNGKEIHQTSKYHMTNISGVLTLKINNCVTEDAGTYRVVCKNTKGETTDYATLDVAGEEYAAFSSFRKDEEPPSSYLPEMTRTEVYHVSSSKTTVKESVTETVKKTSVVEKPREKPGVPAKILTKPQSLTVEEGSLARFECDVDGEPAPSMNWLHEGTVIGPSVRHHIVSTQYSSSFEISAVEMSDEGSYTVLVENAGGKQEAHFTLAIRKSESKEKVVAPPRITSPEAKSPEPVKSPQRVKSPEPIKSPQRMKSPVSPKSPTPKSPTPKSPTQSEKEWGTSPIKSPKRVMSPTLEKKPSFLVGLSDVTAASDSIVKLSVKVTGGPKPAISWMKDGQALSEGGKYEIFDEYGSAYLEIYEAEVSDSGLYKCTATSGAGVVSTACTVTVRGSRSDKAKAEISEEVMKQEMVHDEVLSSVEEVKSSHSQMSITEGQGLTLRANIPGASNIRWILNGVELANSDQYRYGVSGNEQTLTIRSVSQREQGIVTCQAQTKQGLVRCQFDTAVAAQRSDAPHILVQPRSQNVNEGQNVKFTCELAGEPSPEVEWLKDNMIISVTSNMRLSRSRTLYTLEICEARVADSGKYTIKAKNQFGQCSATSSLNVITLVEEPTKMIIVEQRASTDTAASMQRHISGSSALMEASSMQAGSYSSSSHSAAAEYSLESMSALSMSAVTAKSMLSMSSSSQMMEMSAQSHAEASSSLRVLTAGGTRGAPPKIEALPQSVSAEAGKSLTVAGVFSGDPAPSVQWVRLGRTLPDGDERCHVENSTDLSTLVISTVKEGDSGAYTLRLSNELGSTSATVSVHVRSM